MAVPPAATPSAAAVPSGAAPGVLPHAGGEMQSSTTIGPADTRRRLSAFVLRYSGGRLAANADDIVQAAWLRVRDDGGEGIGAPSSSLLARAAYCAVVDEVRRLRRRKEIALSDAEVCQTGGVDPLRATRSVEIRRAIVDCLSRTTGERRLAVTLHLLGHTAPEAARILEWPTKKAENMTFRGLGDLRRCLAAKGWAP